MQETELIEFLAELSSDPVAFVHAAFPWGEGELKDKAPDPWQLGVLAEIRDGLKTPNEVIREAVASGHGIGKSALVAWIILWAISTYEDTRGIVTANTDTQLKTKTWPELSKWHRLFIASQLFTYTATSIFSAQKGHEKTWRIDAIPWNEKNPEAFAGLHNEGKRIIVIFDEASAIANAIWEVTEGAMTDDNTQIIWSAFGNPTRTNGRFYDCFHKFRNRWQNKQIDSRTVKVSNKRLITEWENDWGEDSDFFKVRVRGVFPSASVNQFISGKIVDDAVARPCFKHQFEFAPVIIGVDPAWTGSDSIEIVMRQGIYSKLLATFPKNDNDILIAGHVARFEDEYHADGIFIDLGYGTGIYSAGKEMGRTWRLVSFAENALNDGYANKRAEMWGEMKDWLINGGCIEDDQELKDDLVAPEAFINLRGKLQLESKDQMKERGLQSPNKGDALALTFAYPVVSKIKSGRINKCNTDYDPFAD